MPFRGNLKWPSCKLAGKKRENGCAAFPMKFSAASNFLSEAKSKISSPTCARLPIRSIKKRCSESSMSRAEAISDALSRRAHASKTAPQIFLFGIFSNKLPKGKHFPTTRKRVTASAFVDLIENGAARFQKPPLAETLTWLIEKINYKKAIEEEVKSEKMREFKWENVQECVNALAQYEQEAEEPRCRISSPIRRLDRQTIQNHSKQTNEDKVHLMTLHSAKGLEFPACFLVGLEDAILPTKKAWRKQDSKKSGAFFTSGSPARENISLSSMARSRMRMGKAHPTNPSRFLFEIPKNTHSKSPTTRSSHENCHLPPPARKSEKMFPTRPGNASRSSLLHLSHRSAPRFFPLSSPQSRRAAPDRTPIETEAFFSSTAPGGLRKSWKSSSPGHSKREAFPPAIRTAYPRRQTDCPDPASGLSSVEALYIAHQILGRSTEKLLDRLLLERTISLAIKIRFLMIQL